MSIYRRYDAREVARKTATSNPTAWCKMTVYGLWDRLKDIGDTGVSVESLQDDQETVLLCDAQPLITAAIESAIISAYTTELLAAPAENPLQDEEIADLAAPLLFKAFKEEGWTEPVPRNTILRVIVFDGYFASVGENAVREPVYRVDLGKTLGYLRLPPRPRGPLQAGRRVGRMSQLADGMRLGDITHRQDPQRVPVKTKTWREMAQKRLLVSIVLERETRTFVLTLTLIDTESPPWCLAIAC